MFWLNFLPDRLHCPAYSFSLIISPSVPRSARAEGNTESEVFTNILHFK